MYTSVLFHMNDFDGNTRKLAYWRVVVDWT